MWGLLSSALGELLAPSRCAACDERVALNRAFCPACAGSVDRLGEAPVGLHPTTWAFGHYGGALAQAIQRLKYESRSDLARPLGGLLAGVAPDLREQNLWGLVPIPTTRGRLRERGFNQAALLAQELGSRWRLRSYPLVLCRRREGSAQASLGQGGRAENLRGAFGAAPTRSGMAPRVVLVDDVRTTGNTLAEASACLLEAGYVVAGALVVAHTPRHDGQGKDHRRQGQAR
jgi:ComF family protein